MEDCISFDPANRPEFVDILKDLKSTAKKLPAFERSISDPTLNRQSHMQSDEYYSPMDRPQLGNTIGPALLLHNAF
jgi:hypothetical protein